MERGVTVIAGNIDSWSNYISNGETGIFVVKEDSCELAAKISELLNNEKLQRKIGLKAHQVVASKFNWQYEHEQLIYCYNTLRNEEN
jgi:glycosyltransferase involved in cell wall biosynthesis